MKPVLALVVAFVCCVDSGLASGPPANPEDVLRAKLRDVFPDFQRGDQAQVRDVNSGSLWQHFFSPLPDRITDCLTCDVAVGAVLEAYRDGVPPPIIRDIILLNCKAFHISTDRVCEQTIAMSYPPLLYMIRHTENVTSDRVCAIVYQGSNCGKDDPSLDWSVDLGDDAKPETLPAPAQEKAKADPLNILQLTDIHFDPNYLAGGNAECNEGYCCRSDQGEPLTPSAAAGRRGDYRDCDIPWEVITDTLEHVKTQHQKIDYVYMTGDLIDHAVWDTSREKNNATLIKVFGELKRSFGETPVFPVIGNHEIHPFNLYAPVSVTQGDVSSAYLYQSLADLWSVWLPADTRETILRGGFYTVLVRPGFRVVVLNNNHCFTGNWWLLYDNKDPDGQLQWLIGVLHAAEDAGEKVHLLYHVPTGGSDCYKRWSREFNRVVNRFQKTITGQFSGHTHNDEFRVFYSSEDAARPIGVVHVGGSLTPFSYLNGNYRMFSVDGDTLDVLDYETWIFNLTASNLSPASSLPWERLYSFREAYGDVPPSASEVDRIAHRMTTDEDLVQLYYRHFVLAGDPMLQDGCDVKCMESMVCSVVTTDSNDLTHCDRLVAAMRRVKKKKVSS